MTDGPEINPARWAPDPHDPNLLRYWDGTKWTDQTAPASPPQVAATTKDDWPPERIAMLAAGAAMMVGSFGPWLTAQSGFGSVSTNGMDGDGMFTAVGGGLVILFTVLRKYLGIIIPAVLVAAIGVIDYFDVQDRINSVDSEFVRASVGWGLYAVIGGAGLAAALGLTEWRRYRKLERPTTP